MASHKVEKKGSGEGEEKEDEMPWRLFWPPYIHGAFQTFGKTLVYATGLKHTPWQIK
jgi:hypothetical protein